MEKRKTSAKSKARPPLEIAGTTIEAGSHAHVEIPVARLATGSHVPLMISLIHGGQPGPTIWLSAALHGDELNGIPIIREVIHSVDPERVSGTILAVPIVNAFGLINESRYLPDRRDLNRSFPGSAKGSLAAQLAHLFLEQIVKRCDFGIDLHTGSQGRTNLPQIRCNVSDAEVLRLAQVFGAPVILDTKAPAGSLRAAASRAGIRSLIYETGEDKRFDERGIQLGIDGVRRVMAHLGMVGGGPPPAAPPVVARRTHWIRARRSGMCQMKVSLGDRVLEKQKIANVFDAVANVGVPIRARTAGIIVGHLNHAIVNRGEAIAHVAETDDA